VQSVVVKTVELFEQNNGELSVIKAVVVVLESENLPEVGEVVSVETALVKTMDVSMEEIDFGDLTKN
jgi:hypothetical protein